MQGDIQHAACSAQHAPFTYRARQLFAALRAQVSDAERDLVARSLSPAEQGLFARMPAYDQRHCLDVYHTLLHAGHDHPLLLRAAIFHDCGKVDDDGRPMALGWYVLATLLKRLPALYIAVAAHGPAPLRPIRIYAEHARRGAALAEAAGSPPEVVAAIRHYHDPAPAGLAAALQWADQRN